MTRQAEDILVLDTTLRDGEQTPDVNFDSRAKVIIAKLLDQIGVDIIEVPYPATSPIHNKQAREICALGLKAETLGLSRSKVSLVFTSLRGSPIKAQQRVCSG